MNAREQILRAPVKAKPIKAFGAEYTVRILSGREAAQFSAMSKACSESKDYTSYFAFVTILLLGDATGAKVFSESDNEVVLALDCIEVKNIAIEGLKFNRLWNDEADEAKKD